MRSLSSLRADSRIAALLRAMESRTAVQADAPEARRAAVAILIRAGSSGEPELFFIKRAEFEGDPWSGHVAFPGGREEPVDTSLAATAVRETFEETEIDLNECAELIGALDDLFPRATQLPRLVVRPFVFLVSSEPEPVHSAEVAGSFWVPLSILQDRSVWRDTTVWAGDVEISRFAFHHEGYVIWGMTERILSGLLALIETA